MALVGLIPVRAGTGDADADSGEVTKMARAAHIQMPGSAIFAISRCMTLRHSSLTAALVAVHARVHLRITDWERFTSDRSAADPTPRVSLVIGNGRMRMGVKNHHFYLFGQSLIRNRYL
jgi:hypothetical protein